MNNGETHCCTREPLDIRVPRAMSGMRLDQCLAQAVPSCSRAFLQRCIRTRGVLLNGQSCRPADTVRTNDLIHVEWHEQETVELRAEQIDLDVIYEDADVIVLDKPAGLVVHPAKGNWTGTLVHALLYRDAEHFGELVDEEMRPGIVHRLDKDTSGVMVVARHEAARAALKCAFAERLVEKTYLALVLGEFGNVTGVVNAAIGRHPVDRRKMAVLSDSGKPAVTRYRVLASTGTVTFLEIRIETGRTHQIRVHFADLHHPVLGDPLYGGRRHAPVKARRQMLHAWKLAFPHPSTGVTREYMAQPPEDFQAAVRELGMPVVGRHDAA